MYSHVLSYYWISHNKLSAPTLFNNVGGFFFLAFHRKKIFIDIYKCYCDYYQYSFLKFTEKVAALTAIET